MDGGRIVDQGSHNDLMARNERYSKLIQTFLHKDSQESRLKRNVSNLESVLPRFYTTACHTLKQK